MRFTDITAESGLDFSTTCGELPAREILEVNGGGLALFDYDRDGWLDVFIANGATMNDPERGPGSALFRNVRNGRFENATTRAGIALSRWAMGVAAGDIDGDGWEDLFVPCYGADVLLRNNGNGTFADVSQRAGINQENRWGTGAAFGDIDNDGDLDLYVANYLEFDVRNPPQRAEYKGVKVMAGPHGLTPQHDFLYLNHGDGTFKDIAAQASALPAHPAFGLNAVILDFDNDGWQDIFVANDSMPDFLFRNKGFTTENTEDTETDGKKLQMNSDERGLGSEADAAGGANASSTQPPASTSSPSSVPSVISVVIPSGEAPRFEEIGVISGMASNIDGGNQASMGVGIADVDGNGLPDKFTTVFSSDTNTLHLNIDGRFYEDRTTTHGLGMISRPFLGWACGFFDFDLDGDEDLLMFNGHVYPEATMESMDSEFQQTPLLFRREGKKFVRVLPEEAGAWLGEKHRDRSAVFGDIDNDGDIDVIVNELNGPIRVLRNDAVSSSSRASRKGERAPPRWLKVSLRDERDAMRNRAALGARIELDDGTHVQRRWLYSGGSFQASNPPIAHFGLPVERIAFTLRVRWPDGHEQTIENVQANQHLVVTRSH